MLRGLLKAGFTPGLIIEEDSSLATKSYHSLRPELQSRNALPPTTDQILRDFQLDANICHFVPNQNDKKARDLLIEYQPDLIVLGDTRIIKGEIINIPELGIINVHPGYLPDVRGNNPYIWSILYDLPFGCSVHFIDLGIDTGDLIHRKKIDHGSFQSYAAMLVAINECSTELVVYALQKISSGNVERVSQSSLMNSSNPPKYFTLAPPEIKQKVKKLLVVNARAATTSI